MLPRFRSINRLVGLTKNRLADLLGSATSLNNFRNAAEGRSGMGTRGPCCQVKWRHVPMTVVHRATAKSKESNVATVVSAACSMLVALTKAACGVPGSGQGG